LKTEFDFIKTLNLKKQIEARDYQISIALNVLNSGNSLVVMPTALGKSYIALMITAKKLLEGKRTLFLAPTRPLVMQHFRLLSETIPCTSSVVTGELAPEKRKYDSQIVFATPQVVRNDVKSKKLNLNDFSLIILDEVHRMIGNYAYSYIAEEAVKGDLMLVGFTASPSSQKSKIQEICEKLKVKNVEVKTESDEEVKDFVKNIEVDWDFVEIPKWMNELKGDLEKILDKDIEEFRKRKIMVGRGVSKKQLLFLRERTLKSLKFNPSGYRVLSLIAKTMNLVHAIELLDSQGIETTLNFFNSMNERAAESKSKAVSELIKDEKVKEFIKKLQNALNEGKEHPKFEKLLNIVKEEVSKGGSIIVFAQYRSTVKEIVDLLEQNGFKARQLIGRSKQGMKQKEQVDLIEDFKNKNFNILVCTSIGEEGLSIANVDLVVFFDAVPSEIRLIQRRGRTGRIKAGKMLALVSKGTKDESYFWSSRNKEKKMYNVLSRIKKSMVQPKIGKTEKRQETIKKETKLTDWS
jgi:Fanconi anemia group M protein